ncbi:hypothetical protein Q5M87_10260 [Brachyspira innocens]|uniref:Alpha-1,2-fucosyltransferase n=1 Tax=Brachyspira innocens TaxID=13264 RepID=A0ABT8YW80_9SPIR|nr:hypothetical protein [Brachyspira innocens]MDO6994390.1 hypothetical protein [Brachyspira innocens]MDO7019587.1 hypothetical protein [Brachyspira innocens]
MDNNLLKDINNIVWYIPIKKLRNSLRNYLIKLNEYNQVIKLQNDFTLKKLYNLDKYKLDEKNFSFDECSEFLRKYNELNNSFSKTCVFYVGHSAGFFSEFNNMVLAIIYCLVNKINFKLYSKTANFSNGIGWEEFFKPFCNEVFHDLYHQYNSRYYDPNLLNLLNAIKSEHNIDYFTQDIFYDIKNPEFLNRSFNIEELDINGNIKEVFGLISKKIYRFNEKTENEIKSLINTLNLPKNYIAAHIRAGDKITESNLISYEVYIEAIKKYSNLKDIFIFTDDYSIIDNIKNKYKNTYNIHTLTNKDEKGYTLNKLNSKSDNEKHKELIKLFAMIEVCRKADICFGSYTTNPDSFLSAIMEEGKFIEIEDKKFHIM